MPLPPGARLGPYEIIGALGAGGMGEVYSATDTRLDRAVAIKVLPEALKTDADRRQRFDREARTIAALNHPHICTLHDVGHEAGTDFLVLEHLVGESLQERLSKGPLPLDQSLAVAVQMADALDKAHRQGILHRDLKPGNIFLTRSGAKLLDFGLAKVANPGAADAQTPTRTVDALTGQGTILGTFQYMSPEQLEGREADARTDIWAFGCVVYEMVTGRRTFNATSQAGLIHDIIGTEPPALADVQPVTPRALDHVVKRCLAKHPDDRWQTMRDVHLELRWIAEQRSRGADPVVPAAPDRGWRRVAVAAVAALLFGAAMTAGLLWRGVEAPAAVTRLHLSRAPSVVWINPQLPQLGISRDGRTVAFAGRLPDQTDSQIFVRRLDAADVTALPGTERGFDPAFSPDGEWIVYRTLTEIFKVPVKGGRPVSLVRLKTVFVNQGLSWSDAGWIHYAENVGQDGSGGLFRVRAAGGAPEQLLTKPGGSIGWPQVIEGGRFVVFGFAPAGIPSWDDAQIMLLDTATGDTRALIDATGASARVSASGHLVFVQEGRVMAAPLDRTRMMVTGPAVEILDGLQYAPSSGTTQWAIADNGTLVYQGGFAPGTTLTWADSNGAVKAFPTEQVYYDPRVSPDGMAVAVEVLGGTDDIWVLDLRRGSQIRLSQGVIEDETPAWSPDGRWVAWSTNRDDSRAILRRRADGSGAEETLWTGPEHAHVSVYAPDGRSLLFEKQGAATNTDLWLLPLDGTGTQRALLASRYNEWNARLSPDGRWLAYSSDETGVSQVYVQPFPALDRRFQISTAEGNEALWSRDGRRLFYRGAGAVWSVAVAPGPPFAPGIPERLFEDNYGNKAFTHTGYDVGPDGRFLVLGRPFEQHEALTVVLNWFKELTTRVPVR